jgi:transposase
MVSMEKEEKRKRRKFNAEYKRRAVDLVLKQGLTVSEAARDLGIYESSLSNWVKQARIDQGKGPPGALTTEERQELAQLRKENRILKEEREILKKAAAFFAKESR